jgi:hypothetical protein
MSMTFAIRSTCLAPLLGAVILVCGTAVAAPATSPPPEVLGAITHSLKIDDRKAAQSMTCGMFPGGGRVQQYCSWRVTGGATFAEIWGAVATQMAPGRWLVTGAARPAQTRDVLIRSATADNGQTTTLEACVRKGGAVEPLGGKTVCNLR